MDTSTSIHKCRLSRSPKAEVVFSRKGLLFQKQALSAQLYVNLFNAGGSVALLSLSFALTRTNVLTNVRMEAVSASVVVSVQQERDYGPAGDSRPKMESIIPGLIQLSRVGHKLSEKVVLGLDWAEPWWFEGHSTFFPSSGDT